MKIKVVLLSSLLLLSSQAFAENITVSDPDEVDLENHKTECIYQNGQDTYSYITTQECKYSKTFDIEDDKQ